MNEWTLDIVTERSGREVIGADTSMLGLPDGFYAEIDGKRALVVQALSRFLRTLSEEQASDLGDELHHAQWVLTADPEVIRERGVIHDCDDCRAGLQRGLDWLRDNPGREILVGTLYWAAPA